MNSDETTPLVLFVLGNQADNLGDTILNRNLVVVLRKFGRVILDDSRVDLEYASKIGIPPCDCLSHCSELPNPRSKIGLIELMFGKNPYRYYARSPGHLIPRRNLRGLFLDFIRGFFFMRLKKRGVGIFLIGVTITHQNLTGVFAKVWRWHSRNHKVFSVRDKLAFDRLSELKFSNLKHIPDLFFLSDFGDVDDNYLDEPYCVLNFRDSFPDELSSERYSNAIRRSVYELFKENSQLKFVFCHQVERDGVFVRKLYDSFSSNQRCILLPDCLDEQAAVRLYRGADALFSNRLHCLMFGVLLSVSAFALTDVRRHKKIVDAWREYSLDDYLIDVYKKNDVKIVDNNEGLRYERLTSIKRSQISNCLQFKF